MITYVYIDGFNLYYGCLKRSPYRWLNLETMCGKLLPTNDVRAIKYFTAHVTARPNDRDAPVRQSAYLRALATLPTVSIHLGQFLSHEVNMPLACPTAAQRHARVIKTEEKGSDVNLATEMLCDAYEARFECAVLITNDSDLVSPAAVVGQRLGKKVGIISPHKHQSGELRAVATFVKKIREGVLRDSQLPTTLSDGAGTFHKPAAW